MAFMAQWILPTYQFAASQGAELDIPTVTRIMADYLGIDSFNQWYRTAVPQQLDSVPYTMAPIGGERKKGEQRTNAFGQMNDFFGATEGSRTSNMLQQQSRTGAQGVA